jgi:itaconate CoA-transferase
VLPLEKLLVVSLEQAVAAPLCSCRLADAGARVIKVERPEGDFARYYDGLASGQSSYFVWINRGKESVALDLKNAKDCALFERLLARADVFIQNLKPGAIDKLGFSIARLRQAYPSLITCSISGYGTTGPLSERKAYDLLVQAESGLSSITGSADAPARVGVSVVDIAAGMNAYEAILESLILRSTTGRGTDLSVSLFDAIADWMTVPVLQHLGGKTPGRVGLSHPSIAPYGVFSAQDGVPILISIQSDREWQILASDVLGDASLGTDPRFATNIERTRRRSETDALVASVFSRQTGDALIEKLDGADIAFARVNDTEALANHPHLRWVTVQTATGEVRYPAPAPQRGDGARNYGAVPALGEHTASIRNEFA